MDILKRLEWLATFESDGARLAALGIIAFVVIVLGSIGPLSRVWLADRNNQRQLELQKLKLLSRIELRASRQVRHRETQDG